MIPVMKTFNFITEVIGGLKNFFCRLVSLIQISN